MAKSSGYARSYRARRAANSGRALGNAREGAVRRAMRNPTLGGAAFWRSENLMTEARRLSEQAGSIQTVGIQTRYRRPREAEIKRLNARSASLYARARRLKQAAFGIRT